LRPACISQGALGPNLPARDSRTSQQYRILVQGAFAKRMFGVKEVLLPSIAFLPSPGIYVEKQVITISYFHIMLDQHEILIAEEIKSESLYLGPQTLSSIPSLALKDALAILGSSGHS